MILSLKRQYYYEKLWYYQAFATYLDVAGSCGREMNK